MEKTKGTVNQVDRITYGETVKVNIGNYESRDIFISLSTDVESSETVDQAIVRARKIIKPHVVEQERRIRKRMRKFVDFDTMSKVKD
jgi:hypothetical protein